MSFKHNTAKVSTGIEVHYVEAGDPTDPCVVLIHGYPQTWYMYRHVIHDIAKAGYHVIAPDYRGAGQTSLSPTQDDKEDTGYDKFSMAADLHALYKEVLGVDKAFIVGIDIGSMVATALALRFREDVIGLFASECPQPGTKAYDISTTSDVWKYERVYHFFFHTAPDLPEALTEGKEGLYIKSFYDRLTSKPDFLTPSDQAEYTSAFSAPGRMKAGFEVYRAFRKDCKDVQREIEERGKLSKEVPVLASGGEKSPLSELAHGMMQELAENVTFELVPDSMHWIPEENPEGFVELLTRWMSQVREGQK